MEDIKEELLDNDTKNQNINSSQIVKENKYYTETKKTKWAFRIISVLSILIICILTIHLEFRSLKNNKETRETALRVGNDFHNAMTLLQSSWKTMYYFYQTGDLFRILNCPKVQNDDNSENDDLLLMMFKSKEIATNEENEELLKQKPIFCGQNINIVVNEKDDPYAPNKNTKMYNFRLGEEDGELLTNYPLIKYALRRLNNGEKAVFVAMPRDRKKFGIRQSYTYQIKISSDEDKGYLPLFVKLNNIENKYNVSDRAHCGAIATFYYTIYNANEQKIKAKIQDKAKLGAGTFNIFVENILTTIKSGDEIRIFLSNKFFEINGDFYKKNSNLLKEKDFVIVDIKLIGLIK